MITNERQYRITHAWLEKFEDGARHADEAAAGLDPLLQQAMRDQYVGQAQELREQIAYYDALRAGRITTVVLRSLKDIPLMLIQARIAAGLTHKQLAERLQIAEQQVQRYEARDYQGVSLDRLQTVADALGVTLEGRATLPGPATSAEVDTAGDGVSLPAGRSGVAWSGGSSTGPNLGATMADGRNSDVALSPRNDAWRGSSGPALTPAGSRRRAVTQRTVERHAVEALRSTTGRKATRRAP